MSNIQIKNIGNLLKCIQIGLGGVGAPFGDSDWVFA